MRERWTSLVWRGRFVCAVRDLLECPMIDVSFREGVLDADVLHATSVGAIVQQVPCVGSGRAGDLTTELREALPGGCPFACNARMQGGEVHVLHAIVKRQAKNERRAARDNRGVHA